MSPASEHAGQPLEKPDRSPDTYPSPTTQLELSAYKFHLIAKYFDDVKNSTPQLVRAVIFLWAVFIIPLIALCVIATYINWTVLPFDWKWVTGLGCLGTMAISAMARGRRTRSGDGADRPDSTFDAVETSLDGLGQIAADNADDG